MKISAGILVYYHNKVFLVHPGGPFDRNKNRWYIPKGELKTPEEDHWQAAVREWEEETGDKIRNNAFIDLGIIKKSGKQNHVFAVMQDAEWKSSNFFEFRFKSGQTKCFPETDAGAWFTLEEAENVLPKNQKDFIQRLRDAWHLTDSRC